MPQSSPVRLGEAPARFLPEQWARFRAGYSDDQKALDDLNHPASGWIAYYAGVCVRDGRDFDGKGAETVTRYEIGCEIVKSLQQMLLEGKLVATGIQPPSLARIEIPREFWSTLNLVFANDSAADKDYSIVHVQITRGKGNHESRIADCVAWLKGQGSRLRKELEPLALENVPGLTIREFAEAYKLAFDKRVGRPRKS